MNDLIPVPFQLRCRIWLGVMGSCLFIIVASFEGIHRPDFDPWQQSISALSLGSRGWIQMFNFFVFGAIVLSTVPAWHKILKGRKGAWAFPVLTTLTGISLILGGIFPQDPAPGYDPEALELTDPTLNGLIHLFFAGVCAISAISGLLIMARQFAGHSSWHGWFTYSLLKAGTMVTFVTIYAIWSRSSTGYAGMFERFALMIVPIWGLTFLLRLETGMPFMFPQVSQIKYNNE